MGKLSDRETKVLASSLLDALERHGFPHCMIVASEPTDAHPRRFFVRTRGDRDVVLSILAKWFMAGFGLPPSWGVEGEPRA